MDIIGNIIGIINLVFAGLGIFVTAETLRLRSSTRTSKTEAVESTESYCSFKDSFKKNFVDSRLGSQVVEAEYLYKDTVFNPEDSKIIRIYRNQGYIKLTRLFHQNVFWEEKENHLAFSYYQLALILVPMFILSSIGVDDKVGLYILIPPLILVFFTPFGIYGDAEENSKSKVIFSFFSLGRVKKVRCIIEEQASNDFLFIIYFYINFLGLNVKIPKEIRVKSIEDGVLEYLTVKSFANPIDKKFSYRCLGVNEMEKTTHVFVNDIRYGWMRVIHLLSSVYEKVANKFINRDP